MSTKTFFVSAIKSQKTTGSILPSQKFLARRMIKAVDPVHCRCIVELGTGTGCITKLLLTKLNDKCLLLSFEINKEFVKKLKIKKKNFVLINDDAQKLPLYLKKYGIKKIDYVISSLPLGNMSSKATTTLLTLINHSLREQGLFIQYQYFLTRLLRVKKIFKKVSVGFVPLNIPPAFVYTCKK